MREFSVDHVIPKPSTPVEEAPANTLEDPAETFDEADEEEEEFSSPDAAEVPKVLYSHIHTMPGEEFWIRLGENAKDAPLCQHSAPCSTPTPESLAGGTAATSDGGHRQFPRRDEGVSGQFQRRRSTADYVRHSAPFVLTSVR